jgi:hypothetical protein
MTSTTSLFFDAPSRRILLTGAAAGGLLSLMACGKPAEKAPAAATADNPRGIAKEAWIYAYPMLMNYQTLAKDVLDPKDPGYIGGFGRFRHYAQFFTPANRDIVTPNNDTPYSWAWLDLRAEPWVLSVPAGSTDRYYVHQWMDLFTQIFGYVGVRATGYEPGSYLIAGPKWSGPTPPGIKSVLKSETDLVIDLGRTALHGPSDTAALKAFQAQYRLQPLSAFTNTTPPPPAPAISFPTWDKAKALGPEFIGYLNFLLTFCQPPDPSETDLMQRFATIGIEPGLPFDLASKPAALRQAIADGAADGAAALKAKVAVTESSIGMFGSRAQLKNDYLTRAVAAAMGIYGNAAEEAVYVGARLDSTGQPLDGAARYQVRLDKAHLPPASFFWSATMYDLPNRLLVANPINRYSLGSQTNGLRYEPDGSLILYIQRDDPGTDKTSNWLPSPAKGPFNIVFRLYGPSPEAQKGGWPPPAVVKAS